MCEQKLKLWRFAAFSMVVALVTLNPLLLVQLDKNLDVALHGAPANEQQKTKRRAETIPTDKAIFTAQDYYPNFSYSPGVPDWMERYIHFHNEHIIMDNRTHEPRLKVGTKYLLYSCGVWCGGIGDRINGILTLLYVSMLTNRVFLIEHEKPFPLTEGLLPNRIQWNVPRKNLHVQPTLRKTATDRFNFPYLADPCQLEKEPIGIQVQTNLWYVETYQWGSSCFMQYLKQVNAMVQPEDYRHLYKWGFWTLFRFSEQALIRADELKKLSGLSSVAAAEGNRSEHQREFVPYIGVHMRAERHEGEENHKKFLACAKQLHNATMTLQQKGFSSNPVQRLIYLSDDSYPGSKREHLKKTIQSWDPDVVRFPDIEVFHTERTNVTDPQDVKTANLNVFAELIVLLDSECLVRSRSGFSELPHRISISNEATLERCGMQFDECEPDAVRGAVGTLHWNKVGRSNANHTWNSWVAVPAPPSS